MRCFRLSLPIVLVVLGACTLLDSGAAAAAPEPFYPCAIGGGHGYGYTKLTSLRVRGGVSCSLGEYVAKVHGRASGWKCTNALIDRSKTAVDRRVTCTMPKFKGPSTQWTYREHI